MAMKKKAAKKHVGGPPGVKNSAELKASELTEFAEEVVGCLDLSKQLAMKHDNQIKALEEAICPRVAARLTALERANTQQMGLNHEFLRDIAKLLHPWGGNRPEDRSGLPPGVREFTRLAAKLPTVEEVFDKLSEDGRDLRKQALNRLHALNVRLVNCINLRLPTAATFDMIQRAVKELKDL